MAPICVSPASLTRRPISHTISGRSNKPLSLRPNMLPLSVSRVKRCGRNANPQGYRILGNPLPTRSAGRRAIRLDGAEKPIARRRPNSQQSTKSENAMALPVPRARCRSPTSPYRRVRNRKPPTRGPGAAMCRPAAPCQCDYGLSLRGRRLVRWLGRPGAPVRLGARARSGPTSYFAGRPGITCYF